MDRINESHFSFKCPMSMESMQPTERGRFCGKCQKEVFDLTNCSLDEVRALEQKHGPICGSIRMAQVATVAISLAAAACQESPKNNTTAGMVCVPPPQEKPVNISEKEIPLVLRGSICLPKSNEEEKTEPTSTPPNK